MPLLVRTLRAAHFFALGALLAACSANSNGAGALPGGAAGTARAATSSGALLYHGARNRIETYAYPGGTAGATITTKFDVVALCSNSDGDVFVPGISGTTGAVYEYAHAGSQPIATLQLPKDQLPVDCSSDPKTGNLAVTSYEKASFAPQINVFVKGTGTPAVYTSDALGAGPQPAYDDSGNLYVTSGGNAGALLPAGSTKLVKITTNAVLGLVAHAQWDGKYFALQSFTVSRHQREFSKERIYRFTISGTTGTLKGVSTFKNWSSSDPGRSWISGDTVVVGHGKEGVIWKYPGGGAEVFVIHFAEPGSSVTVST
jgi:hypothetical protein